MQTFTFDGPLELDVRMSAGEIDLRESAPGETRVQLEADTPAGRTLIEHARVDLDERAGRLVVHVPRDGGRVRSGLLSLREPQVTATLWCPAGSDLRVRSASANLRAATELGTVTIETASGDVELGEVRDGLDLSSASGDVRLTDLEGGARIRTASGDVRTRDIDGGLSVRTASGDVAVRRCTGEVLVRSVAGDVAIDDLHGRDVSVTTTSGDVRLGVARGLGIHLDVATVSGALTSDLDEDDGTGGVDVELRARTVSGDVHLQRSRSTAPRSG